MLSIKPIMPGAVVVHADGLQLAVGFPEEIVKAWWKAGAKVNAWLLPDLRVAHGVVQWAVEFALYDALFVRGTFGRGEKIPVVVSRAAWLDLVEYLRLTLLGPTRDEMRDAGVAAATAEMLAAQSDYLALKRPDGAIARIEDFLEPIFFDDGGTACLGGLTIEARGGNRWAFRDAEGATAELDLVVPPGQHPTYAADLPAAATGLLPQPFELVMLGASNGFDPEGACSNLLVQADGQRLLIDAGPYIRTTLRHAGVGIDQLDAIVVTHAHEDHAVGLVALLERKRPLTLYTTPENAWVLRRKLAILHPALERRDWLLDDAFDLSMVEVGPRIRHAGVALRFHYTMHSVPCTGLEISVRGPAGRAALLVTGDNDSRVHIDGAADRGAITTARHRELLALYAWRGDLIVADAGGGAIHGSTDDFDGCATPVVYCHTGKLAPAQRRRYTLAHAGFRQVLIAARASSPSRWCGCSAP